MGKLFEVFKVFKLKKAIKEMEVIISKRWKKRKTDEIEAIQNEEIKECNEKGEV